MVMDYYESSSFHSSSVFSTVAFSKTLFLEEANDGNEERDGLGVANAPESEFLTESQRRSECKDHSTTD
jgi:hypothetical protein